MFLLFVFLQTFFFIILQFPPDARVPQITDLYRNLKLYIFSFAFASTFTCLTLFYFIFYYSTQLLCALYYLYAKLLNFLFNFRRGER